MAAMFRRCLIILSALISTYSANVSSAQEYHAWAYINPIITDNSTTVYSGTATETANYSNPLEWGGPQWYNSSASISSNSLTANADANNGNGGWHADGTGTAKDTYLLYQKGLFLADSRITDIVPITFSFNVNATASRWGGGSASAGSNFGISINSTWLGDNPPPTTFEHYDGIGVGDSGPSSASLNQAILGVVYSDGGYISLTQAIFTGAYPLGGAGASSDISLTLTSVSAPLGSPTEMYLTNGGVGNIIPISNFPRITGGGTQQSPFITDMSHIGDIVSMNYVSNKNSYLFPALGSDLWYDPPLLSSYDYKMNGPGDFTSITLPTGSSAHVIVNGVDLGSLDPGGTFDFGPDITEFLLDDISPLVDLASNDPGTAFPVKLDYTGTDPSTILAITPLDSSTAVPEPSALALLGVGLLGMGAFRRQFRAVA